jgi:hypothetical protein
MAVRVSAYAWVAMPGHVWQVAAMSVLCCVITCCVAGKFLGWR